MAAVHTSQAEGSGKLAPLVIQVSESGPVIARLHPGWDGPNLAARIQSAGSLLKADTDDRRILFEDAGLDRTDTVAVAAILEWIRNAERQGYEVDTSSLPESVSQMVRLAREVPERRKPDKARENRVVLVGQEAVKATRTGIRFIEFLGELVLGFIKLPLGRTRFRSRDFWIILQSVSVSALPIVSLLALLTGMILGFVGAVHLRKFGATIYMTDLVGLAMARELGAIMTGVIMSGRTGAAFAAHIGSMNVNQEVDALETFGLSPIEFLVVPRTLALVVMMPLLTLWAIALGWFGGFLVAIPMDINIAEYWIQLTESTELKHTIFGISKAFFFGIVIATTGCYYGLRSGRSSAAVGVATTKAVVSGITWIIILDALFAIMDEVLQW